MLAVSIAFFLARKISFVRALCYVIFQVRHCSPDLCQCIDMLLHAMAHTASMHALIWAWCCTVFGSGRWVCDCERAGPNRLQSSSWRLQCPQWQGWYHMELCLWFRDLLHVSPTPCRHQCTACQVTCGSTACSTLLTTHLKSACVWPVL